MSRARWLLRRWRRFRRDERGFAFVFVAVALPALLGLVGLAVDVTRLLTLDTQLAEIADAAALAAANRLDRSDAALADARAAGDALLNTASFAQGAGSVRLSYRFATDLADLRTSPTYTLADTAGADAVYVEVTTAERSIAATFLQFVGARPVPVRRSAIAESRYYACDVTPALMCHRHPDAFLASAKPGRQYLLRGDGSRDDGTIALVDRPGDPGGRRTITDLASNTPAFCYADHVTLRPQIDPDEFEAAVNVRFDRYVNRLGAIAPDLAAYAPAPDIIQGRHYNSCSSPSQGGDVNPPYHLPRDSAFIRIGLGTPYDAGIGDWKSSPGYGGSGANVSLSALEEYIFWDHANKGPLFQSNLRASTTRYQLYLKELGLTPANETQPVSTVGYGPANLTMPTGGPKVGPYAFEAESPVPRCYAGSQSPVEARRRILYLAIAECGDFNRTVNPSGISERIGKFFLTEPASGASLLLEFENRLRPGRDDHKLRHVVQLVDAG